ncbi:MAG: HAD family hydrolase [Acidimicrobiales bacterium]
MDSLAGRLDGQSIKLVATDLDGTLVQPDGTISPRTTAALNAISDAGIELVLATGRPPPFVLTVLKEIPTASKVICANGAATLDPTSRELTHTMPLGDNLAQLISELSEAVPGIGFAAEWEMVFAYDQTFRDALNSDRMHSPSIAHIEEILNEPVYKILVMHPDISGPDLFEKVNTLIGQRSEPTHSGLGFVEVAASGVNKSVALSRICAERGIEADNVIAFGDMPNDLAMLKWAGFGVAMDNADTRLKQVSDFVTRSHTDDGVAVVLEALLLGVSQPG